jgi:hypothetical protein
MTQEFSKVKIFRANLQNLGADFICNTTLPDTLVSISFLGPFLGETVLWNLTLCTLKYHMSKLAQDIQPSVLATGNGQFIEIKAGSDGVYPLTVCLDVATIDEPVIIKTIIMMRNYKRLAIGKMEFGRYAP